MFDGKQIESLNGLLKEATLANAKAFSPLSSMSVLEDDLTR
jgi:hypothetical protein